MDGNGKDSDRSAITDSSPSTDVSAASTFTNGEAGPDRFRRSPLIVAIDGPAGSGKSTVAAHLAKTFGLLNLETGAMYRALALKAIAASVSLEDSAALSGLAQSTRIDLQPGESANCVVLDGVDVTARLRTPEVTAAASRVSVFPGVRSWMVAEQRGMGRRSATGVVMEGRDIGTVVFPEATVKIFLEASVEARGDRRFQQGGGGSKQAITDQIAERDSRDRDREASPLRPAADAVILDTTGMPLAAVLERAADLVRAAIGSGKSV